MADNLDPNVLKNVPNRFELFQIVIERYNKSLVDITTAVNVLSLYESIYTPFMYGDITVVDNSAMFSTFPFIGQERVLITWVREGKQITKIFSVVNVYNVSQFNETVGTYTLSITSEKQMRNAISLFSKSYKGNSSEIIEKIYKEFLLENLDVQATGYLSHNVVFPFIKPLQAINMIQRATPAFDKTPLFVYETLYGEKTVLNSMKQMLESDPVITLDPKVTANLDPLQGMVTDNLNEYRNQVYSLSINKAYDTLDQLGSGAYACQTLAVDITERTYTVTDFDFTTHAPTITTNDWVSTFFTFDSVINTENPDNVLVNGIRSTKAPVQYRNSRAYDDFPNLNTVDENLVAGMRSYMKRLKSTSINVHTNSIIDLQAGKTVDLKWYRFSPRLQNEDPDDKINSGKYLIAALRHYIENGKYTMSLELVRDGIGEDARLYVNGEPPNFGNPPRAQKSLLTNYEPDNVSSSIIGDLFDNE